MDQKKYARWCRDQPRIFLIGGDGDGNMSGDNREGGDGNMSGENRAGNGNGHGGNGDRPDEAAETEESPYPACVACGEMFDLDNR